MYTYVQYAFKNFYLPLYHFSNKCLSRFKNSRGKKGFKATSASHDTGTAALSYLALLLPSPEYICFP